jgi:hypothetical protein
MNAEDKNKRIGEEMRREQDLLKALLSIRAELVIKLTELQEKTDPRYPRSFIDGMKCAFREAIITCDINTKDFFEEKK